jgi:hemolysin III
MTFRSGSTTASPTFAEVVVNNAIQGAGVLLSLVGLALLVAFAAADGGVMDVTASAVFGATLVLLYAISTVNHAIPEHVVPPVLPLLDHIAIYLLIAGTYTPFALIALRGARGWWLFGTIWLLATGGSVLEFSPLRERRGFKITLYLVMGWLGLVALAPLAAQLQFGGTALLLAGGVAYTLGVPFHLWRGLRYHNALWHAFVLTGSTLHFFAVLLYVLPLASAV